MLEFSILLIWIEEEPPLRRSYGQRFGPQRHTENIFRFIIYILQGVGISSLTTDIFTFNTKLKMIDISDNEFTSIPNGLFDNLNSLSQIRTENIPWKCTCENLWFVTYITENNITLIGDNMCNNANGKRLLLYSWTLII